MADVLRPFVVLDNVGMIHPLPRDCRCPCGTGCAASGNQHARSG
jgi:hypothetical protein